MSENGVHYVYGEQPFQQLLPDQEQIYGDLGDLICSDGSQAILVDGQYIVTDTQTLVLEEGDNVTQYFIENPEEAYIESEETEVLQLVEDESSNEQQIIYYTNEASSSDVFTMAEEAPEEEYLDEEGNIYPFKRVKVEGQVMNFDELMKSQVETSDDQQEGVHYAVLDGGEDFKNNSYSRRKEAGEAAVVDLAKITGRNLITGQTVTLHSYMEKLKRKLMSSNDVSQQRRTSKHQQDMYKKPELTDLLNRKISIGKTRNGKNIFGKIIQVGKRLDNPGEDVQLVENGESTEEPQTIDISASHDSEATPPDDSAKIVMKRSTTSKESFDEISKTLAGVMEMDTVKKKLENKNLAIKLVEKKFSHKTDSFVKTTSYCCGYMEKDIGEVATAEIETMERWKFVLDQDLQNVLLGDHIYTGGAEMCHTDSVMDEKKLKFRVTTSLTIVISQGKLGNKTIRVNLNPAPGNLCTICAQYFKTSSLLRHHITTVHKSSSNNDGDPQQEQDQENTNIHEEKLFRCSECSKCFASQVRLLKHLHFHELLKLNPLLFQCSICGVRCGTDLTLRKHLLTHSGLKPFQCEICQKQFLTQYDVNLHRKIHFPDKHFVCNICQRIFSRHSNLLRHQEIHKGTGALYKCDICNCSYNYVSSLTRHMVQNHINDSDLQKRNEVES